MAGTLKRNELNIRDPYVLFYNDTYYLYGTRSASCWDLMDGFDVYESKDLSLWSEATEVFHKPENFPYDRCFWAPEVYAIEDRFYMVTTLHGPDTTKGIHLLVADSPKGPFRYVRRLTPKDWNCIDGTLLFEKDKTWLIFSHTLEDTPRGDMCALELSWDTDSDNAEKSIKNASLGSGESTEKSLIPQGEPIFLYEAADAPWSCPIPFAKEEFGIEEDAYFTDGPCAITLKDNSLAILWSAWSKKGYAIGVAKSASGKISGPWVHDETPFYPENGGHGMCFQDRDGKWIYTLHYPNDKFQEHPVFYELIEEEGTIRLGREL